MGIFLSSIKLTILTRKPKTRLIVIPDFSNIQELVTVLLNIQELIPNNNCWAFTRCRENEKEKNPG